MEFHCVILCGSIGSRMYPLTYSPDSGFSDSDDDTTSTMTSTNVPHDKACASAPCLPKCLLPIAGKTILSHLLDTVLKTGLPKERITVLAADECHTVISDACSSSHPSLSVVRLPRSCRGSFDALSHVPPSSSCPPGSHLLLLPGDLVLSSAAPLLGLCEAHRTVCGDRMAEEESSPSGRFPSLGGSVTALLSDLGAEDEDGRPLREAKKAKLNLLAREEEEVEVLALSSSKAAEGGRGGMGASHVPTHVPRVLYKKSLVEVSSGADETGETPKVSVPKSIIRAACTNLGDGGLTVRADLLDLHAYCLAPWVHASLSRGSDPSSPSSDPRPLQDDLTSLQADVLPVLVDRQTSGYGSAMSLSPSAFEAFHGCGREAARNPYVVAAHVVPREAGVLAARVRTPANYLYAAREAVARSIRPRPVSPADEPFATLGRLPGSVHAKDSAVWLEGSRKGSGGACKNSTICEGVVIGNGCKINNCVLMEGCVVGDRATLQNSVVGRGARVGQGCNLNECQVAGGAEVQDKTKVNGEAIE